jgi:hypothetical protein
LTSAFVKVFRRVARAFVEAFDGPFGKARTE